METINNFYGTNQFILIRNDNLKTLINLRDVSDIYSIKNVLTINRNGKTPISEKFDSEDMCEKFFKYMIIAISEGDRIISRKIFEDYLDKDNNIFGDWYGRCSNF